MTEAQWLKSKDGDAMLALVTDRLSGRKWALLACGVVRRVFDQLPGRDDGTHPLINFVERNQRIEYANARDEYLESACNTEFVGIMAAARRRQELIGCDPDAAGQQFQDVEGRRTNPAVPLFEAASGNAANAVARTGEARQLAERLAWQLSLTMTANELAEVRRRAVEAQVRSAEAGILTSLALELKVRGDEMADRGRAKTVGVRLSEANNAADTMQERAGYLIERLEAEKTRSESHAFAKLLREQLGNPFRPYRFDPRWRSETVLAVARGIEQDRAFDRMPILADALLDADCDEEAILRHLRGAEPHTPEPPHHARGCWVLDLIREREPELFAAEPLESRPRPQGRRQQLGRYTQPPEGMT
jgi:hypothetical protein